MKNKIIKKITLISMSSLVMATSAYSERIGGLMLNTDLYSNEPTDLVSKTIKTQHNTKKIVHSVINTKPQLEKRTKYKSTLLKGNQNYNLIEILHNIEISKKIIGKIEYSHFLEYFNLNNSTPEEIQSKINEFASDGILGPIALEKIYTEVYSINLKRCSEEIKIRWEIYNEMKKYSKYKKNGYIHNRGKVKVFDKNYYYGENQTYDIKGTFIDSSIDKVENSINLKGNQAFLRKINGKYVVLLYVKGELQFSSYTSPGNTVKYGEKAGLPLNGRISKYNKKIHKIDKYHISGAKASVKIYKGIKYGAKMPYAVNIIGGIYIHAGNTNGKKRSHGCLRLGLKKAKGFYELFGKIGNIKWNIKTK